MDTAQWPQGIGVVKPMEAPAASSRPPVDQRKPRPQKDQALNCPRCSSTNTKFCYYNNYSLSQPRYFCKTCRRYWTEGGSLRNVPVGGGSRKNHRRSTTASLSSSPSAKVVNDHLVINPPSFLAQNPKVVHQGQDLNLAYPPASDSKFVDQNSQNPSSSTSSAMELLKSSAGISSRGLISFMPMPGSDSGNVYANGFALHEFKPSFNFSLEGFEGGYGGLQGVEEPSSSANARRLFPPPEDSKAFSSNGGSNAEFEHSRGQADSGGCWSGMFGGAPWQ